METKVSKAQAAGAILGSVALASSGLVIAAPMVAATGSFVAEAAVAEAGQDAAAAGIAQAARAEGSFTYSQEAVTPVADIRGVHCDAASALCASLPDYGVQNAQAIAVSNGSQTMQLAIADGQQDEGYGSYTMACSCATNAPGGGAVANADVAGIQLASILAMSIF